MHIMAKPQAVSAITSLPASPQDDRRSRMLKYVTAMSIRVVCILMCFFVQGWWLAVFAVGAIVLPYLAVVLANVGGESGREVLRPGGLVPVRQQPVIPDEVTADDRADAASGDRFTGTAGPGDRRP